MKSWIVERLEQRAASKERDRLIAASAERMFGELWLTMAGFIEEAQQRGIEIFTNGMPLERVVTLTVPPRTLTVTLKKDQQMIAIRGVEGIYKLTFDVCPDHVVCLKLSGEPKSYSEAAQAILDPFLFPEFQSD